MIIDISVFLVFLAALLLCLGFSLILMVIDLLMLPCRDLNDIAFSIFGGVVALATLVIAIIVIYTCIRGVL